MQHPFALLSGSPPSSRWFHVGGVVRKKKSELPLKRLGDLKVVEGDLKTFLSCGRKIKAGQTVLLGKWGVLGSWKWVWQKVMVCVWQSRKDRNENGREGK